MAKTAAFKVASALYDSKIIAARERLTEFADKCVKACIPAPVIGVIDEYAQYFSYTHGVVVATMTGNSSFPAKSTIAVPNTGYYLRVTDATFKEGKRIYDDMKKVEKMKGDFMEETKNLLYQELRFENKVREKVPEMLSYIEFPVSGSVPAKRDQYYSTINNLIRNVKKLKK